MTVTGFSQVKIKGKVTDAENSPIPGANVLVKDTKLGTATDFDGNFHLTVSSLPVTLMISYVGYEPVSVEVTTTNPTSVVLKENGYLDDVVVTASRTKEKIKESPVSIERMSLKEIRNTSSASFYDGLENIKGVQLNTNSLTFQSVNTRGFASFANNRFVQLIDGMDNTSPALNFPLGNLVGINELDVQSVEILPGASSALYGANAFNGILTMNSKSPFTYKGLSAYVKYGQTKQKAAGTNPYSDVGVRYAWGGDIAAAKINFSFLKGTDWYATDESDIDQDPFNNALKGSRASNPSYDGMNVYGDEIATVLPISAATGGLLDDIRVSRTGYNEASLTDNEAKSMKADIGFNYRPSGQPGGLEFSWNSRFGTGKTIYQGSNRYVLDGILIHQHKLEVKNKHFFVRAYYTGEDAGNSYDTRFTAWNINRKWRSDRAWFNDYARIYSAARLGMLPTAPGTVFPEAQAHQIARDYADNSPVDSYGQPKTPRYKPGTPEFKQALEEVTNDPNFITGGKFIDKTNMKHIEGNYNFKDLIKFAEIQVGGSLRRYSLHSEGTIFTDYPNLDPIHIDESGAYVQATKKLMDNNLKFTTSLRYDKQRGFDGNFSPRFAVVYSAGEHKEHNFRASFQTGFRNPSTQDLYIGLNLGFFTLVGAAPDNLERYHETVVAHDPINNVDFNVDVSGTDAYHNSYTRASVEAFSVAVHSGTPVAQAAQLLKVSEAKPIQPEQVTTMEFGYRGQLFEKLGIDFTTYYNSYNNFGAGQYVIGISHDVGDVHNATGINALGANAYKPFLLYTNAKEKIASYGVDLGFNYKLNKYVIGLIYDYAKMNFDQAAHPDFRPGFNTPEHRVKFSLANDNAFKNFGFRVDYKYQTAFEWQASFADGTVPARSILDAQINYNIKKFKTKIKLGGTNLLGQEYLPAPGTGMVGSMFYIGLIYNN